METSTPPSLGPVFLSNPGWGGQLKHKLKHLPPLKTLAFLILVFSLYILIKK